MQVYGPSHHPISSHLITPHFSETSVYVQNIPHPLPPSLQIPILPAATPSRIPHPLKKATSHTIDHSPISTAGAYLTIGSFPCRPAGNTRDEERDGTRNRALVNSQQGAREMRAGGGDLIDEFGLERKQVEAGGSGIMRWCMHCYPTRRRDAVRLSSCTETPPNAPM
jgi:hypothetical protein